MAPEQLEGRDADGRTDIFAFGAVLYEMAVGKKAFSGASQASLISAILRDEPQPISQVQPTSPPALDRVVKTCLAKDPEERWQSAADLKRELRWIGEGSQSGVAAIPAAADAGRGRRGGGLAWVVAALLLLGAGHPRRELSRARGVRPQPSTPISIPPEGTPSGSPATRPRPTPSRRTERASPSAPAEQLWVQSLARPEGSRSRPRRKPAVPVLVPGRPIDRLLRWREAQDRRRRGRPGAGDRRRADAARRHLGPGRNDRLHAGLSRRALSRPRPRAARRRR